MNLLLHNHFITQIFLKKQSGEAKDSAIFAFFFLLHKRAKQNVLNSTLNMTYENFLEQVNLAEQLTSSDFGVSTGLISQGYWEASKWYFVNVERGNIADKLQPPNVNVSFNNNSNVPIDVIIFTFYSDQLTIDVETGIVTKYFFKYYY